MKKIALLLALSLVFGIFLVGCGNNDDSASKDEEPKEDVVEEEEEASENKEVVKLFEKAEKVKELSYDYVKTSGDKVEQGTIWTKDNLVKNQIDTEEVETIYFLDMDKMISHIYLPESKIAIKNNVENPEKESITRPHAYMSGMDLANTKVVETTTYEDQECKILSEVNSEGTEILRMWFSTEKKFPIKVESNLDSDEKIVMEYKNIKTEKISKDLFELPEDVVVEDQTK